MEFKQYYISTNFDLLNSHEIWLLLKDCFWCKNIPIEYVKRFVQYSLCFGVYHKNNNELVGFGRVISDYTTYAYICDVVINKKHREQGLASALIKVILAHSDLQGLKTWSLRATNESENIYKKSGFKTAEFSDTILEINDLDIYDRYDFIMNHKF